MNVYQCVQVFQINVTDMSDRYPPFMERKSGSVAQQRVWEETRIEFETKAPEVKSVFKMLDTKSDA